MKGGKLCPECGAPKRLVKELRWLSNGTIVQRKNPHHRLIFIECNNINATYRNVEEMIGRSIEDLLIEAKREATFDFLDHLLLSGVKTIVKLAGARIIARNAMRLGGLMGYGWITLSDLRRVHGRDDYATFRIEKPYSLPLICGDLGGAFNAVDRREAAVSYVQVSQDVYEVTCRVSDRTLAMKRGPEGTKYVYKPGDIEIDKCPGCGGPAFLSQYRWNLERGLIVSRGSGHRKAVIGPAALEAIMDELEGEFGDTIPQTVIDAQRRFVKTGFYSLQEASTREGLRSHLAVRGMGNLREMEWKGDKLRVRLENACLNLILVGLIQGLFELSTGSDAETSWKVADDGDLIVDVRLKA
jgi:hypothetical protein